MKEAGDDEIPVGEPILVMVSDSESVSHFDDFELDTEASLVSAVSEEVELVEEALVDVIVDEVNEDTKEDTKKDTKKDIRASPSARVFASSIGVELSRVPTDDPRGIIRRLDVEAYSSGGGEQTHDTKDICDTKETRSTNVIRESTSLKPVKTRVSKMRKVIAERLLSSVQNAPHFSLCIDADVSVLKKYRDGFTYNDFFMKAAAQSLLDVPEVNSHWEGDVITTYHHVDISMAVSLNLV